MWAGTQIHTSHNRIQSTSWAAGIQALVDAGMFFTTTCIALLGATQSLNGH